MVSNLQTRILLTALLVLSVFCTFSQNKKIDRLEQYYDQGHYKLVFRKSSRLLENPEYNSSALPSYYKAMSSFQLMQNQIWLRRKNAGIKESISLMNSVIDSKQWPQIMESHSKELTDLQVLFDMWLAEHRVEVSEEEKIFLDNWILTVFRDYQFETNNKEYRDEDGLIPEGLSVKQRTSLIHYAYEFMGIPYKWGGVDENGFDCSGYTQHIFKWKGIELPRISKDQYKYAKKIKETRAYMGDLVFFSDGEGISHVGILVNKANETKKMIHSSSSKGISVADIEASEYWRKRIVGYGRITP